MAVVAATAHQLPRDGSTADVGSATFAANDTVTVPSPPRGGVLVEIANTSAGAGVVTVLRDPARVGADQTIPVAASSTAVLLLRESAEYGSPVELSVDFAGNAKAFLIATP